MDAAAAAAMACCMLRPDQTGVGGYAWCAVVLEGKAGRAWCVDANARAPAAAHEQMFEVLPVSGAADEGHRINRLEYACRVKDDANVHGPLAIAVPGMMAGMGILWERWGQLEWRDIIAPSQALLEQGFPYGPVARSARGLEQVIRRFPATAEHLMPDGKLPNEDDTWHRPDMEKTLARIVEGGWRGFYQGELGRAIADHIQSIGGIVTREDMARYEPQVMEPLTITYREATVHGMTLPSGGLTSLETLNMLGCFPASPQDSAEYWHRLAEVLKLAWRDRLIYLGDPDFVEVAVQRLLSQDYAAGRVEGICRGAIHCARRAGRDKSRPYRENPGGTLHVSAGDAEGNLVAATITQGDAFGSCVTVPGTGIILGHGMCRLDPRRGRANSVAPRKRPLNNMAPMVVRLPGRDAAVGMPGGRKIVSVAAQLVRRIVDQGATGRQAATAPRLHVEFKEPVQLTESAGDEVIQELRRMGHEVETAPGLGGAAHCVEWLARGTGAPACVPAPRPVGAPTHPRAGVPHGWVRAGSGEWAAGA